MGIMTEKGKKGIVRIIAFHQESLIQEVRIIRKYRYRGRNIRKQEKKEKGIIRNEVSHQEYRNEIWKSDQFPTTMKPLPEQYHKFRIYKL